jgi:chromosomal replication initiator protein
VAAKLGLTVEALISPKRTATLAGARQLAMYLTRELTDLSLPEIARAFNRRDHTTVLHAIRRVETRALEDAGLSRTVEELTTQLRSTNMDSTNVGSTQD